MRRAGGGRRIAPGVMLAIALVVIGFVLVGVQAGRNGGVGQAAQQAGDGAVFEQDLFDIALAEGKAGLLQILG